MQLIFNLAGHCQDLKTLSECPESLAYSVIQDACLDQGIPLPPSPFDRNISFIHSSVYEIVKGYVDEQIATIPTPDNATLVNLGHLRFQLTFY
ncbi:hypothetical protein [Aeromonas phage ZPAH34]|uniref:hypothetical protein n=1 Tax=Aeromonas phage ZPAH34 TaxID=2924888 RepID=UPI002329043F|nr:hypothetical protein PQD16_gp023 [Aeromonas phage ZPAH34]UOX39660.1 hypothetical protein [Aeromonas phage ZPAH34]